MSVCSSSDIRVIGSSVRDWLEIYVIYPHLYSVERGRGRSGTPETEHRASKSKVWEWRMERGSETELKAWEKEEEEESWLDWWGWQASPFGCGL